MQCIVKIVKYTAMIPTKKIHVAIRHSDLYAKNFYCTSIIIWNNIINNINIAVSLPTFKKLMQSYLHCKTLNVMYGIIFLKIVICAQLKFNFALDSM